MSFLEEERKKAVKKRNKIFEDSGGGVYRKISRDFYLTDRKLNLWKGIREQAIKYFSENKIVWWDGKDHLPTGHLLSSQIACINHLFYPRLNKNIATAILQNISPNIVEASIVDNGYVEFEAVGGKNYLGERSHTRGANATSVDAIMVGKKVNGKSVLFLIEWKYTEKYSSENKYIPARAKIYDPILKEYNCPIQTNDLASLYYEPFYQLFRQTLLGWKMVKNDEYNCDEYIHLHVIPEGNLELKNKVTSPDLEGSTMSEAWKGVLVDPDGYQIITPIDFLSPMNSFEQATEISKYLEHRYT